MTYATLADIQALYGLDLTLRVWDRDESGAVDTDAANASLVLAQGEADGALSVRYTVPLVEVTDNIKRIVIDIAVYRGAMVAGVVTEEIRKRYEDARADLKLIANGTYGLGISPAPQDEQGSETNGTEALICVNPRWSSGMRGL